MKFATDPSYHALSEMPCRQRYIFGIYGHLISSSRGFESEYYHFDGVSSTRQLTNLHENITGEYTYSAFGDLVITLGGLEIPFLYKGSYGFCFLDEISLFYARARDYTPTLGTWMSIDPLMSIEVPGVIRFEGRTPYHFLQSNPTSKDDPSGMLTITRANPNPVPTNLPCGTPLIVQFEFTADKWLQSPTPRCRGWIVQHVVVDCNSVPCPCTDTQLPQQSRQLFSYLEAFSIPAKGSVVDTVKVPSFDNKCGNIRHTGVVKVFCNEDMRYPMLRWSIDPNRAFGTGDCETGAGEIPAVQELLPSWWWTSYQQAEGVKTRVVSVNWQCCPCAAVYVRPHVFPWVHLSEL